MITEQEDRPALEPASVSPELRGGTSWFEYQGTGNPHLLHMYLPISAEEMVAALYRDREGYRDEVYFADGRHVWEHAALVVVMDGLSAVQDMACEIRNQERRGEVADPGWLAYCRQRVAEVTGLPTGCRTVTAAGGRCGACVIDDRGYWRDLRTRDHWRALWAWEIRSPAARRDLTLRFVQNVIFLAIVAILILTR